MKDYFGIKAVSASLLKEARKSLAHARLMWEDGISISPTPAMQIGTYTHCAWLEPEVWFSNYVPAPECDRRTKAGKEAWAKFQDANKDKVVITQDQWDTANRLADILNETRAAELLEGRHEQVLEWEEAGLPMKAMLDIEGPRRVVDLKTCADASPEAFSRQSWNLGYHLQAAHYERAYEMKHFEHAEFYFVCIETTPPHNVAIYRVSDDLLDRGREQRLALLDKLATAIETGDWPGYGTETKTLEAPRWA